MPYPLYAEKVPATEKLFAKEGMAELVCKAANLSSLEVSEIRRRNRFPFWSREVLSRS
jgi:hypothetical protein